MAICEINQAMLTGDETCFVLKNRDRIQSGRSSGEVSAPVKEEEDEHTVRDDEAQIFLGFDRQGGRPAVSLPCVHTKKNPDTGTMKDQRKISAPPVAAMGHVNSSTFLNPSL